MEWMPVMWDRYVDDKKGERQAGQVYWVTLLYIHVRGCSRLVIQRLTDWLTALCLQIRFFLFSLLSLFFSPIPPFSTAVVAAAEAAFLSNFFFLLFPLLVPLDLILVHQTAAATMATAKANDDHGVRIVRRVVCWAPTAFSPYALSPAGISIDIVSPRAHCST